MSQKTQSNVLFLQKEIQDKFSPLMNDLKCCDEESNDTARQSSSFIEKCAELLSALFLHHVDLKFVEAYCTVFRNLEVLFNTILNRITLDLDRQRLVDIPLLQNSLVIVQVLIDALEQIIKIISEFNDLELFSADGNVPCSALSIIHHSYLHCKSSESSYGESFSMAADILGDLFRKTFSLQKVLTVVLSKVEVPLKVTVDEKQVQCYILVFDKLLHVACIVGDMDNTLLGSTWKLLTSFMGKCKSVLHGKIELKSYILELVLKVKYFLKCSREVFENNYEDLCNGDAAVVKNFTVFTRMATFLAGSLGVLLSDYSASINEDDQNVLIEFIYEAMEVTHPLLLSGFKPANSSPHEDGKSLPLSVRKLVTTQFMAEVDKVVAFLIPSSQFQKSINADSSLNIEPIAQIILILRIVKPLGNVQYNSWFGDDNGNKSSIYTATFKLIPKLYRHLQLSTMIYMDEHASSLYEAILARMCASIVSLPPSSFNHLETVLLNNLLSREPYQYILASDLWCFLARFSSADLCCHHVKVLITLTSSYDSSLPRFQLESLLKRLYALLLPEHQESLASCYSLKNERNVSIWALLGSQFVGASSYPSPLMQSACEKFTTTANSWMDGGGLVSDFPILISNLRMLRSVMQGLHQSRHDKVISKDGAIRTCMTAVATMLIRLWCSLNTDSEAVNALNEFCSELSLTTSHFIHGNMLSTDDVNTIFRKSRDLMTSRSDLVTCDLYFNSIQLLSALRHSTLPADILDDVVLIWKETLRKCDVNWLLRHTALDALESFSRVTKQPQIVARICSSDVTGTSENANGDVTNISSWVKSHLRRDVNPLPCGTSISDIVSIHESTLCDPRSDKLFTDEKFNKLIGEILCKANQLRSFSPEHFTEENSACLKEVVQTIQEILSRS